MLGIRSAYYRQCYNVAVICKNRYSQKVKPTKFSESAAYFGNDRPNVNLSEPLYVPSPYDTDRFMVKRLAYAVISVFVLFGYFIFLREPNDIDFVLNTPQHVITTSLERRLLVNQIQDARTAGKSTKMLEAELAYVEMKGAAMKEQYEKSTK